MEATRLLSGLDTGPRRPVIRPTCGKSCFLGQRMTGSLAGAAPS